jgi:hypothetical protein
MKKIILLMMVLFAASDVFSQIGVGIGTGGMGVGVHIPLNKKKQRMQNIETKVQQMRRDLELDSVQVLKVRSLLIERERRKSKGEPMLRDEFNRRIDEMLTDEQKVKFKELHRQERQSKAPAIAERKDSTSVKQKVEPDTDWDDVYK